MRVTLISFNVYESVFTFKAFEKHQKQNRMDHEKTPKHQPAAQTTPQLKFSFFSIYGVADCGPF